MIIGGQLLLEGNASRCRLAPGFIRIADGVLTEVVEGEIPQKCDIGGRNHIIAPGFIDTHLHLPQFDMIGAHGMPLLVWLREITFLAERRWENVDFASTMIERVLNQCLSHGTTAFCAFATVHHQSAAAALKIATNRGMRGVIGQVLMDRLAPSDLCKNPVELIAQTNALINDFPPSSRMAAAITPRFAICCTPELLRDAGTLAKESGAIVQSHLAETVAECDTVRRLYGGTSYAAVYEDAGLLTDKSIFGHGIYLDEDDRRKLSKFGSIIAHCPTANSFLRSGTMNRGALVEDDVNVTLGSDIGAGYERSMVRVARAMIEAAASLSDNIPTAAEAWFLITAGNANKLGWHDAGRLQVGSPADIVVIEPDIAWQDGFVDPLSMLLFAWDDRWIKRVFLRGVIAC